MIVSTRSPVPDSQDPRDRARVRSLAGYEPESGAPIVGDGQTATMRCYLGIFSATSPDKRAALSVTGVSRDNLAKIDGRWLFTERHIQVDPQD